MSERLIFPLTLVAALGSGLVGGVFFAFSAFVMKGIAAMQSINVAVLNRWFMAPFFGTAAACAALGLAALPRWREPDAAARLVGAGLYLAGGIGVTVVGNVPRNNALAAIAADGAEGVAVWGHYVPSWTAWNTVRTVACLGAAAAFALALTGGGRLVEVMRGH